MMKKTALLLLLALISACNDPEVSGPGPGNPQQGVRAEESAPAPEVPAPLATPIPLPSPIERELPPGSEVEFPLDIEPEHLRGEPVVLNPETIRKLLLEGNSSIILSANRLQGAKLNLDIARGNLLPSLNLTALLPGVGGSGFFGASVNFLLPFLVPSRWFEYAKAKALLEAEKESFLLMELNQYASAYALYFTFINDLDLREELIQEVRQFEEIQATAERAYQFNLITDEELKQARSQTSLARIRVTRINELVRYERELLRFALAVDATRPIEVQRSHLEASEWESKPVESVVSEAAARAPESRQLGHLMKAAKKDKWSRIFSFISGASVGTTIGSGGGGAFGGLAPAGSFNIGFGMFPAIRLSENNKKEIEIRRNELGLELTKTLSTTLGKLTEAQRRLTAASEAEENLKSVFESKLESYELGIEDFTAVLFARSQMREATIEKLKTLSEINAQRVTLERTLILGEFARIQGCPNPDLSAMKKGRKSWEFWKKDQGADMITVEKACAAG